MKRILIMRSPIAYSSILMLLTVASLLCAAVSTQPFECNAFPAPGNPMHLAVPVHCIQKAREFYGETLGLTEGRRCDDKWQDYSLFGHQLVCHYVGNNYRAQDFYNPVDGDEVPVPHFGVVLTLSEFQALASRLKSSGKVDFIIEPHKRFEGMPGEQWTMFFKDPSGNSLEFKAMTTPDNLFAKYNVQD